MTGLRKSKQSPAVGTQCSVIIFFRPSQIAKEVMNVVRYAPNGTVWVIEGGEPAFEFVFPDRSTMKSNRLPVD